MKKDIKGYEGFYMVNNKGDVFGLDRFVDRKGVRIPVKGMTLKNYRAKNGYYVVNLNKNGHVKQCYVHSLVAEAFIGERPHRVTVNHKDGDKLNNHVSNLEYATYSENNLHARRTGLNTYSPAERMSKPVAMMKDGVVVREFNSLAEAVRHTRILHIGCVCRGQRKQSGNYQWKYI